MRLIFRILAAPVSGVLSLAVAFFSFALSVSGAVLGIASVLGFVLALAVIITADTWAGLALMAAAFLISPFGLLRFAQWLVRMADGFNGMLKDFILG